MKLRSFLFILIPAIVLGALVFLSERRLEYHSTLPEKDALELFQFQRDDADSLEVKRDGKIVFSVKRNDKEWSLTYPLNTLADSAVVRHVLTLLSTVKAGRVIDGKVSDSMGLSGGTSISISSGKGTIETLYLGTKIAMGAQYYARMEGSDVVVTVPEAVSAISLLTSQMVRNKTLSSLQAWQVDKVEMTSGKGRFVMDKQEDGWHINTPVDDLANSERLRTIVHGLCSLQITKFVSDVPGNASNYGLQRPDFVIRLIDRGRRLTEELWVRKKDSGRGLFRLYARKLAQRDTGWLQFYCEDNQEILDTIIMAYRISEAVRLPSLVILDAFYLSHTSEPVQLHDTRDVCDFIGQNDYQDKMDTKNPASFGLLTSQEYYYEFRHKMCEAMNRARSMITEVGREFRTLSGRSYDLIETFFLDNAEYVLLTSATITSTARAVVKNLRQEGYAVGLLKIRCFRPFPSEEITRALTGKRVAGVVDRNISIGNNGIFYTEVAATLAGKRNMPRLKSFIAGLGGRDVTQRDVRNIFLQLVDGSAREQNWIGLKQ
jgi:hypothetical protein